MTFCRTLALSAAAVRLPARRRGSSPRALRCMMPVTATSRSQTPRGSSRSAARSRKSSTRSGFEDRLVGVDTTSLYPAAALRQTECRLHAPALGRRRARAQSLAGARRRRAPGRRKPWTCWKPPRCRWCWCPKPFPKHGLIDKIKLVGHAMGADKRGRMPDGGRDGRSGATARVARQGDEAGARDVRDVAAERPGDGRRPARPPPTRSSRWPAASTRSTAMTATRSSTTRRSSPPSPTSCSSIAARQGFAGRRDGVSSHPAFALTPVAAQQDLHLHGRPLSARLRAAHGGRGARSRRSSSIRRWRRRPRRSRRRCRPQIAGYD